MSKKAKAELYEFGPFTYTLSILCLLMIFEYCSMKPFLLREL